MRYPPIVLPPDPETRLVVLPPLSKAGLWDDIEAEAERLNAERLNVDAAAAIAKSAYDGMAALADRNRRYWAERAEVEAEVLAEFPTPPHTASDF